MRSLLAFLLPVGSDETGNSGTLKPRSGWLDAETLLIQTEMFLQPEAFRRFTHFYTTQVAWENMQFETILSFDLYYQSIFE